MRRRSIIVGLIGIVIIASCIAYGIRLHILAVANKDTVDRDFVAKIQKTKESYVFEVTVQKANKNVDKKIGGFGVVVDLALKDSRGRVFASEYAGNQGYAIEVSDVFGVMRHPGVESLTGKVRLTRRNLPVGNYIVQPNVRIYEDGKDRISGKRYSDGGSVVVPAGNSIRVRVDPPWMIKPLEEKNDVVDPSFMATITSTNETNIFLVEVKRINHAVDKTINSHHEIFVDFELVDENNRSYKGDFQIKTFSEKVGDDFSPNDIYPYPSSRKGRVKLVTTNLSPGTYIIKPNVRIVEEGKDRVGNLRAEAGSVAVPAGNSIKVTITE